MAGNARCVSNALNHLRFLLMVGALAGLALAISSALSISPGLSSGAVARVNGVEISGEAYTFAVQRLAGQKSGALTNEDRLLILNQLVEEELFVQRGIEIGLLDSDPTVRKAIANAEIDSIVAEAIGKKPSQRELRAFYEIYKARFAKPERIRVQEIYFDGADDPHKALLRVRRAYSAITEGMPFGTAGERYGDQNGVPLPDTELPPNALRGLLGSTLTNIALSLRPGEVSPPIGSRSGYHILRLVEHDTETAPVYKLVEKQVEAEYLRRARDDALQTVIDDLRRKSAIVLAPLAPH